MLVFKRDLNLPNNEHVSIKKIYLFYLNLFIYYFFNSVGNLLET